MSVLDHLSYDPVDHLSYDPVDHLSYDGCAPPVLRGRISGHHLSYQ